MYERFTDRARKVMQLANQEAQRFNHEYIGTEHILLGLVKEGSGVAANVLKNFEIDLRKVRLQIEKIIQSGPDRASMGKLPQTPRAKKVIEYAIEEARELNHNYVGTEHLLLGLLREQEGAGAQVLLNLGLKLEDAREELLNLLGQNMESQSLSSGSTTSSATAKTPGLDSFGYDLTVLAHQGKLDPVIGRTREIEALVEVLCQRQRNNPLVLGEAGVGKTAVVEGLAQWIAANRVPESLRGFRIVSLDVNCLVAGTKFRGMLEERVSAIHSEVRKSRNVILCFDHFPRRTRTLLYHAVFRSEVPCIVAVTPGAYRKLAKLKAPLVDRFQIVPIMPPSRDEALEMLRGLRERYEAHHAIRIQDDALTAAIDVSERLLPGRCLPEKAVRAIDRACARVRLRALAGLPGPTEIAVLDAEIERLNEQKENLVAECDFEKAAALRDQADKLKQQRERLVQELGELKRNLTPAVDVAAVEAVLAEMVVTPPEAT